jgi:hypothetical protein
LSVAGDDGVDECLAGKLLGAVLAAVVAVENKRVLRWLFIREGWDFRYPET